MSQFPNLNDDITRRLLITLWRTTITILTILAILKACGDTPT